MCKWINLTFFTWHQSRCYCILLTFRSSRVNFLWMTVASRAIVTSRFGHKVAVWNCIWWRRCVALLLMYKLKEAKSSAKKLIVNLHILAYFLFSLFLHLFLCLPHLYLNLNLDTQLQTALTKEKASCHLSHDNKFILWTDYCCMFNLNIPMRSHLQPEMNQNWPKVWADNKTAEWHCLLFYAAIQSFIHRHLKRMAATGDRQLKKKTL